jgi:hypothetical protein
MGANLDHISILSFILEPTPSITTTMPATTDTINAPNSKLDFHPFSIPEDLPFLYRTIEHINARLVIFDPIIVMLSFYVCKTQKRLFRILSDFNAQITARNTACLIIRNCPAKGGLAHPCALENSEHFTTIAASRLLLAHDPFVPKRILLCHVHNHRTDIIAPTYTMQIQPLAHNPDSIHFIFLDIHELSAQDFYTNRPDVLHRRLLSKYILELITHNPDPTSVPTIYAHCPKSSFDQIPRCLKDLLDTGLINHPAPHFYTTANPAPTV